MREVIQGLLETEQEAARLVQAARQQSEQIVAEAQKRAQSLIAQSRTETRLEAEKLIESAVHQALTEKKQQLTAAEARIQQAVQLDGATRAAVASAVSQVICGDASAAPHPARPDRKQ